MRGAVVVSHRLHVFYRSRHLLVLRPAVKPPIVPPPKGTARGAATYVMPYTSRADCAAVIGRDEGGSVAARRRSVLLW
jgi:hypothetical protein